VELPTYTNIWRIEKRLYKLYDFRLPMPLPLGQIAVFTAIVVPYVVVLALLGVPFSHTLLWLYVLPPGVLTWLATRPVLESKRLPELVASQLRYLGEPRTWCRMAPLTEKDEVIVAARVWRQRRLADAAGRDLPASGKDKKDAGQDCGDGDEVSRRPEAPSALPPIGPSGLAVTGGSERVAAATAAVASLWNGRNGRNGNGRAHDDPAAGQRAVRMPQAGGPQAGGPALPQTTVGQQRTSLPQAQARPHVRAWPQVTAVPHSLTRQRAADGPQGPPPRQAPAKEQATPLPQPPRPKREASAGPPDRARPEGTAVVRERARPEGTAVVRERARPEGTAVPRAPARPEGTAVPREPARPEAAPPPQAPVPPQARPIVTVIEERSAERPLRMIERALGSPAERRAESWHDRVVVVPGGHRPGQPDQQQRDRARARLPIAGTRRIVVLGCTVGAGQSVTTLRTGELLASLRDEPVAVLDLNPGKNSLSERARVMSALAGEVARSGHAGAQPAPAPSRLEVITSQAEDVTAPGADSAGPGAVADAAQIFELLAARYALTLADPAAPAVPRVLSVADQLLLVAPASSEAASAIAMTMEWLEAHGHARLAEGSIAVLNGVSKHTMTHVEQAEAMAVGRCRAIIRVPWADQLSRLAMGRPGHNDSLGPEHQQTAGPASASAERAERAYTALAGVLVASMVAAPELPRTGL
jgi:MinD-like ATPase involved in chromosome partitioning or flagellar assembly